MEFFAGFQIAVIMLLLVSSANVITVAGDMADYADQQCGNLTIPYPFRKISRNLSSNFDINRTLSSNFDINCSTIGNSSVAYWSTSTIEVINISIYGQMTIMQFISRDCNPDIGSMSWSWLQVPFAVSKDHNKFTVIGCDSYAYIRGIRYINGQRKNYTSGCMSICNDKDFIDDTNCSGSGCCQIEIPDGLKQTNVTAYSFNNHTNILDFNNCTYAFVAENQFKFKREDVYNMEAKKYPMVVEWKVPDEVENVCKSNARKVDDSEANLGYLCQCNMGFEGNPYVNCTDVDECESEDQNDCIDKHHCKNMDGSYTCACLKGYHGDGRKNGTRCTPNGLPVIPISLGVGIGFISLIVASSWIYLILRKRRHINLKEKFFKQNGGSILQEKLSDREGNSFAAKIFTAEELKKAANNYDENSIIGKGGYGTVHRGTLSDGRVVAIKKSITLDQSQMEQFINEVVVLSQINHRNIVKLLGCCLETQVPLLVYEFITNGTLFDYIHNESNASAALSWQNRLRIAAEIAEALSYLHSAASIPIIHRDVKTTNVLLDTTYTAKVSDFGASRLVPTDEMQLSTMVQGTWGYLDPEYMRTNQLTEKSDVYSFGVVLIELLTSMKALSFDRPEEERSLAMYFLSSLKKGNLLGIIDSRMINEENKEQIEEVARMASRCLALKGEERPSMKEIAMELQGLRKMEVHPWFQVNQEDTEFLLNNFGVGEAISSISSGFDSVKHKVILSVGDGR